MTSSPLSSMRPEVGASKPPIIRRVVVLPQPDGPSRLKNSPVWTSRLMWSTTTASPYRLTTSTSLTSTVATFDSDSCEDGQRRTARDSDGARIWSWRHECQGRETRSVTAGSLRDSSSSDRVDRRNPSTPLPDATTSAAPSRRGRGYDIDASTVRTPDHDSVPEGTDRRCPASPTTPSSTRCAPSRSPSSGATSSPSTWSRTSSSTAPALALTIELTTPACPLKDEIERTTHAALGAIGATRRRHHLGRDGPPVAAAPGRAARPGRQEHHRGRVGQGRRRQEHGQRQPRRRARPGGRVGRAARCRHHRARTSR